MKVRGVTANIYVGNKNPKLNLIALVTMLMFPRFLILQEAKNFQGSIPGYKAYRAPAHLAKSSDDRSTMFLVRRGTRVVNEDWTSVPGGNWQFHENQREPRVYGKLTLAFGRKKNRKQLNLFGVHRCPLGPKPPRPVNREAWIAEHQLLAQWGSDERDSVWGGDWNTRESSSPDDKYSIKSLAKDLLAQCHLDGIDGFLTRGLKVLSLRKLNRKFGSDAHHPVVIQFEL